MEPKQFTHHVAVAGVIVKSKLVLMLRRTTPPFIWAPPGGRLLVGEDPLAGVRREVLEECGIEVKPVRPIALYMGEHKGSNLLAIVIACSYLGGEISLSEENNDFTWIDPDEFTNKPFMFGNVPILGSPKDYQLAVWLLETKFGE